MKDDPEDFKEAFKDRDCGYNEYIVMQGKTLQSICNNDKTFEQDFTSYLHEFDPMLKKLLGIERGKDEKKYLNMDYYVGCPVRCFSEHLTGHPNCLIVSETTILTGRGLFLSLPR